MSGKNRGAKNLKRATVVADDDNASSGLEDGEILQKPQQHQPQQPASPADSLCCPPVPPSKKAKKSSGSASKSAGAGGTTSGGSSGGGCGGGFIDGYGDEDKPPEERKLDLEAFQSYRTLYQERLNNQTFASWVEQKKAWIAKTKTSGAASSGARKPKPPVNKDDILCRYYNRLLAMERSTFECLEDAWCAGHTDGSTLRISAADLEAGTTTVPPCAAAMHAVYRAAVSKGVHPKGIATFKKKKLGTKEDGKTTIWSTVVSVEKGDKWEYIGPAVSFHEVEASPFCITNEDRKAPKASVAAAAAIAAGSSVGAT